MKLRKITIAILTVLITLFIISTFNQVKAVVASEEESMYLNIVMLRSTDGYGYRAIEKNIWKIVETNEEGTTTNYSKTIYCLKGGPGFGSETFGTGAPIARKYNQYFDMKSLSLTDDNQDDDIYIGLLPDISSTNYKSLLWLLENCYVAPKENTEDIKNAEEFKGQLLKNAGITDSYLDDDDIDAVQQLAVWHFTNNDEGNAYKIETYNSNGQFEFYINAIAGSDANYIPMSDDRIENGWDRAEQCVALYQYLVNTATKMGESYEINQEESSQPYKLAKLTQTVEKTEDQKNYIIGPFKIEKNSNAVATLNGTFKNGDDVIEPTIQNSNGEVFDSLEETVGQEFYIQIPSDTEIEDITLEISGSYFDTKLTYWSVEADPENPDLLKNDQPVVVIDRIKTEYSDTTNFTKFDLALRKFIVSINDVEPTLSREPQISTDDLEALKNKQITTANKQHSKNALTVKTGDKVVYTIRVYNEGDIPGYVKEITDYLPEGLKFVEDSELNTENGWTNPSGDGKTIVTSKLSETLIPAFDGTTLKYLDVQIECEVIAKGQGSDTSLKNIAEITKHSDENGDETIIDIDSTPNNVDKSNYGETSQEDDDDFERLIIPGQSFDLSLRKFITSVNDEKQSREPVVDISPLLNGKTTATYTHPKAPIGVDVGDEVTYTIRVYNEGDMDAYVHEITDYLPEYLEFINNEFNASYGWKVSSDGRTVTTNITSPNTESSASSNIIYEDRTDGEDKVILKAFDGEKLDYIDVKIQCSVKDTGLAQKLTNIAEITNATDAEGNDVKDRDSKVNNVTLPEDNVLPDYKDTEINQGDTYIPGQQDDDDFEKVIVQRFDLALRKFITKVNETEITNRVPVFSKDSEGKYTYTHPKTPVEVATGDIVIYTLRIFNEGNQPGYAEEIKDDLPEGLEYLPENEVNSQYRWKMYKEDGTETEVVTEAKTIRTDYLSKEQEASTGRNNLIKAFDTQTMTMPDYKEVKIAFKVTEPNTSDRIIINIAEISEDKDEQGKPVEDVDSTPNNDQDGEDDIDIEKIKVKYFDLSLKKIITKVTMTLDGKTTITETKHTFEEEPEPVVKIELGNHKIKTSVLKFTYKIRVTNEGEVDGYVKEIRDYIPEGLKFVAEDNENWTLSEDGKTVTTEQLKDTLLQPGESAEVEITLRWINGQNNLGLKKNIAEISKDYNDHDDTDDIDSTPDNYVAGEDDIDDASVVLTIVTGIRQNYTLIIAGVLMILITGVVLIKRFVL